MSESPPYDSRTAHRALLRGLGGGVAYYAVAYAGAATVAMLQGYLTSLLIGTVATGSFISVVLLASSVGKLANPRTRAFGAGQIAAIAIGIIVGGGICVAVYTDLLGDFV